MSSMLPRNPRMRYPTPKAQVPKESIVLLLNWSIIFPNRRLLKIMTRKPAAKTIPL